MSSIAHPPFRRRRFRSGVSWKSGHPRFIPNMNDEIVSERCGVALGEFSDALFFDLLRREERMLALRNIVTAHALQSFFGPFDLLSDMLRVEIDHDGVVEDLKRSEAQNIPRRVRWGRRLRMTRL